MTFDKIAKVLAEQLGIDQGKITLNSKIVEDLGADSLDVVELLVSLEEEYNVKVSDEEASGIHTVGDIVALIDEKTK
ncbi:MAG: acyl carrier protein [Clostridia bacterium]|nr:acyl carrier protein [Clostridia bacterium]